MLLTESLEPFEFKKRASVLFEIFSRSFNQLLIALIAKASGSAKKAGEEVLSKDSISFLLLAEKTYFLQNH